MKKTNISIYNVKQVALIFGVMESTIREWAKAGKIPTNKIGKRWFFEADAILNFLDKQKKHKRKPEE